MRRRTRLGGAVLLGLGLSTAALGLPWDLDMADSQAKKAYAHRMAPPVDGAVAQPNLLSPTADNGANYRRGSPESVAISAPPSTPASVALGEQMYGMYCTPCHGSDGRNLGPVAQPGRYPAVAVLAGPTGRLHQIDDTWLYLTIRNGGGLMPSYSWAMSDREMWSVVHYARTLSGAAYTPEQVEETP